MKSSGYCIAGLVVVLYVVTLSSAFDANWYEPQAGTAPDEGAEGNYAGAGDSVTYVTNVPEVEIVTDPSVDSISGENSNEERTSGGKSRGKSSNESGGQSDNSGGN